MSQCVDVVSGTNVIQACQRRERKLNNNGWMGSIGGSAATVTVVFFPPLLFKIFRQPFFIVSESLELRGSLTRISSIHFL